MHTTRRLATLTVTLGALTLSTAIPAAAQDYPGATVSRYTTLDGTDSDRTAAHNAGCAEAENGTNGVRFLMVGTQENDTKLRQPGTTTDSTSQRAPTQSAAEAAAAWTAGFDECRTGDTTAELALAVNNKSDGGINAATAGTQWADIVNDAATTADSDAVTITGGIDAEPSWSSPKWARSWVDAFTAATDRTLYTGNSADGCPQNAKSTNCSNGWTLADVYYVATGAAPTIEAIPQIYRTDGAQARQWAAVSSWGTQHSSGPVRFAGAMSQNKACDQRGDCSGTNNTPKAAWEQLRQELNAHDATAISDLPTATDIRWP